MEIIQSEEHKKRLKKFKRKGEKVTEKYLKNKNLGINFSLQIQEAQQNPSTIMQTGAS